MSRLNWTKIKDNTVNVCIALIILAGLGGYADGIYVSNQNNKLANEIVAQQNAATKASNHHHQQTDAQNKTIITLLGEVKASAAAIQFEGAVIAYQNGQIIAAQQQGHAALDAIQQLQQEVGGDEQSLSVALKQGQAQINAYLGYLSCLNTHTSNSAVCGAAPPLPSTT